MWVVPLPDLVFILSHHYGWCRNSTLISSFMFAVEVEVGRPASFLPKSCGLANLNVPGAEMNTRLHAIKLLDPIKLPLKFDLLVFVIKVWS